MREPVKTITAEEAADIRERENAYQAWAEQFRRKNGWIVIPAEEVAKCPVQITNEERGKLDQFEFFRDKPQRRVFYFKFVDLADNASGHTAADADGLRGVAILLTTWTGDKLARGYVSGFYRGNFGDRRATFRATCLDGSGVIYSGTAFLDAGDYAHAYRIKGN